MQTKMSADEQYSLRKKEFERKRDLRLIKDEMLDVMVDERAEMIQLVCENKRAMQAQLRIDERARSSRKKEIERKRVEKDEMINVLSRKSGVENRRVRRQSDRKNKDLGK